MTILESDGRFEKALNHLRLHKNMYEVIAKTTPHAQFPPSLTLEILPYTIMKSYSTEEKTALFTDENDTTTPTANAFTGHNNLRTKTGSLPTRQRINKICPYCGISGHDINSSGCDFAASLLLANDYLKHNPQMKRKVINTFKTYQQQRLNTKKGSLARRITKSAQDKRIGITPTVKLLIEAIADNIEEEIINTPTDNDILDITDILQDTSLQSHEDTDNYHDSCEQHTSSNE